MSTPNEDEAAIKAELQELGREQQKERARAFYMCGGVMTLSEFRSLSQDEVLIYAAAHRDAEIERIAKLGLACQSLEGAAQAIAPLDGGEALEVVRLARLLDDTPDVGEGGAP